MVKKILLVLLIIIPIVYAVDTHNIAIDMDVSTGNVDTHNIAIEMYGEVEAGGEPVSQCDCPTGENWVIDDGSNCELTSLCNVEGYKLIINDGALRINGGKLIADSCSVKEEEALASSIGGLACGG